MEINREKLIKLYEDYLERNDIEGYLPYVNDNIVDTICFLIENNQEVIEIHPSYTSNVSWAKTKE